MTQHACSLHRSRTSPLALSMSLLFVPLACAQGSKESSAPSSVPAKQSDVVQPASVSDADAPAWMKKLGLSPNDPIAKEYMSQAERRKQAEKEVRKIRLKFFGQIRNTKIRQEGILKLREFTDPALFPTMLDVFAREDDDVRGAVLDIFAESKTPEGDAVLAWQALFGADSASRGAATDRIAARQRADGAVNERTKVVIYQGLASTVNGVKDRAAKLAETLDVIDAIPWLAAAQLNGRTQGSNAPAVGLGAPNGALGWIVVGAQTAYIADLQPSVSQNAAAFDPQVATITEGVVLRVLDAVVYTYHIEIHDSLVGLASKAWGEKVDRGWGYNDWRNWYKDDLLPELARKRAAQVPTELPTKPSTEPSAPATTPDAKPNPDPK